jgi:hypothetical protein
VFSVFYNVLNILRREPDYGHNGIIIFITQQKSHSNGVAFYHDAFCRARTYNPPVNSRMLCH